MFDFYQIAGPEDSKQENFSTLCSCLLMRLYPDAKPVEGKGGDEGIDTFVGDFDKCIKIFQHKYFLETLKSSQKRQITESLKQVLRYHTPISWILMLPKDLTPAEQRWFESLKEKYISVQLEWWGKTKILELLAQHRDLAAAFQPARPITLMILGKDKNPSEVTLDELVQKLSDLGFTGLKQDQVAPAIQQKLNPPSPRAKLRILIWGSGDGGGDLYVKRVEIRDRLNELGHNACFSEDIISAERLSAGGLNVTIEEYMQAKSFDYIICLMTSPGSIGEVHDFVKKRDFACKMMVCIDQQHKSGYSAEGALRIFEGFHGRLDWFKSPEDITQCHLATRIFQQVEKTVDAKTWELLERGDLL